MGQFMEQQLSFPDDIVRILRSTWTGFLNLCIYLAQGLLSWLEISFAKNDCTVFMFWTIREGIAADPAFSVTGRVFAFHLLILRPVRLENVFAGYVDRSVVSSSFEVLDRPEDLCTMH